MTNLIKKYRLLLTLLVSGGVFVILFSFASAAEELGNSQKFFLDTNYDSAGRSEIMATLKKVSDNAYFYIEDEYWASLTSAQKTAYLEDVDVLAQEFDENIYPNLTYFYGSEWNPGIDNDSKMTILLTKLKSTAGGYFDEKDERKSEQEPTSNSREMIYLSSIHIANPLIYSLLAHEMQHLISWNQKERLRGVKDDIWLNELRSEYAPTVCGYDADFVGSNLERRVEDFLANPFDSLTEWKGDKYDYPSVNIMGHYLAEQYGEDVIGATAKNSEIGIASIEQALRAKGYNVGFSKLFNQWTIASYLNDKLLYGGIYGYKNPYLKGNLFVAPISYSIVSANVINISQDIKDWAPHWYRFTNKQDVYTVTKDLEIEFEGATGNNFNVLYIIDYINQVKDPIVGSLNLTNQQGIIKIPDFKNTFDSVTIIVSNQSKTFGFTNNDPINPFSLSVATTLFQEHVDLPGSTEFARPEDYGLKEGDLIRAEGDFDIFIINQYGYKRLFLNPTIFNMYGHLTGGWNAVKTVKPSTRDAFKTSNYYRYVDSPKVYEIEVTGGDTGVLHWLNITGEQFLAGAKPESVFTINKSELNWYPKGTDKTSL